MRTVQRGAVYSGDKTIGFRCYECGRIVQSMWGDTCNRCREEERRHRELIKAIDEMRQTKPVD